MMVSPGILIVGYGKHVQDKILPAISNLDIPILGIVSANKNTPKTIARYTNINEISELLKPSHVYIASKPNKHLDLISEASLISKNLMVEKPIAVKSPVILKSKNVKKLKVVTKEAMMYKYNPLNKFLEQRRKIIAEAKIINVEFIIPTHSLNKNKSFRQSLDFENNMLFDIGCYIYDFIWSFDLLSENLLSQNKVSFDNGQAKYLMLKSDKNANKNLCFKFGYGQGYSNVVKFTSKYNVSYELKPFFYGRVSDVIINLSKDSRKFEKVQKNHNCFIKMIDEWYFNKKSSIQDQLLNIDRISFIQKSISKLSKNWRLNV